MGLEDQYWDEKTEYINELLNSGEISSEEHAFMMGYYSDEFTNEQREEE